MLEASQESKYAFLMKCGGYVRSLELREECMFSIFGKLVMHYCDNKHSKTVWITGFIYWQMIQT